MLVARWDEEARVVFTGLSVMVSAVFLFILNLPVMIQLSLFSQLDLARQDE